MTTLDMNLFTDVDGRRLASTKVALARPPQNQPARPSALSASLTIGWRALLKYKHAPSNLIEVALLPIIMTLMFTFIFGGALAGSTADYVQQLIPGILVFTVTMMSQSTAVGLKTDITKGIFDRFRSISFWRPAVLVGMLMGDMLRYLFAALVAITLGLALGFRPEGGVSGVLLAMGLLLLYAFSFSWIWTALGLWVDDMETLTMVSGWATFPLTFLSNVFVDPATMPEFLQAFVGVNPITLVATAMRGLMHGTVATTDITYALLSFAVLIALFGPLSMYLYNHKSAE